MSECENCCSRKKRLKTSDEQVCVQDCLNPNANSVIYNNVNIGCTLCGTDAQPSTSKTSDEKDENNEVRRTKRENEETAIRSKLQKLYENITLPTLPWIEGEDLPLEYFTQLQLESEGERSTAKSIELHNLFDAVNEKNPRRILIESQPGFGKTTLTHKIISDWVTKKDYVKRFKFAFLIILRSLKTRALKDEIIEIINNKHETKDEMWEIINDEETLLILDGLDEVGKNVRADIVKIFYPVTNECKMTVVTTCRTGLSKFKKEEVKSIVGGISIKKEFWCKKIAILGISEDNRDKFLGNFIEDEEKDDIMPRLHRITKSIRKTFTYNDDDDYCDYYDDDDDDDDSSNELFKSPLMLILLVYVTRENHAIKIKTRTDMYKQFVDYIIRRSIAKTDPEKPNLNFTVFDSSLSAHSSTFHKFGEMCWKHILSDKLQFDSNDDTEAIYQMGFLLKHETKKKLGILVHYEGFHLSILEFAAAVFLKKEFQDNHDRFCDSLIKKIVEICDEKGSSSLVIPFLCGLLENDVAPFFDRLSDYHVKYWIEEELTESILWECEMNELVSEYFGKIVPPYVYIDKDSPSILLKIENLCSQNFVDILEIDLVELLHITQPLHVRVLICHCDSVRSEFVTEENVLNFGTHITCEFLAFDIDFLEHEASILALKLFEKISSRDKKLDVGMITVECCDYFKGSGYTEILKGVQFDLFASMCYDEDVDVEVIKKILEYNTVTNIYLDLELTQFEDDFCRSLSNNDTLHTLCINTDSILDLNLNLNLNFDTIAENTKKEWKFLLFQGIKLECKAQVNSNRHVKSLSINADKLDPSLVHDANVMLSVVPTALRCKSRALELLNNDPKAYFWAGWDEIVELTLSMGEPICEECAKGFNNFSRFRNLKILTLEFFKKRDDDKLDLSDIIKSIGFLTLDRLEIRWLNMDYYEEIIRGIQNLILKNKNFHAIVLAIVWGRKKMFSDGQFNLKLIKSVLQCDRISFTFYFDEWSDLMNFVQRFTHDLFYFNVEYAFIEGNTALGSSLRIFSLLHPVFRNFHKLELTLRKL